MALSNGRHLAFPFHIGHDGRSAAPADDAAHVRDELLQLLLTGPGERLELVHRASNRDIFARGALEAAVRLSGRGPGRYDFGELLLAGGVIGLVAVLGTMSPMMM